jgi:molybdopterin-guanine dinucleotide biosynthesis protein MobB
VLLISSAKMAMVMQLPEGEPPLEELVARHLGGRRYDVVLVEGYKHGDLPKIEIHRAGVHDHPVYDGSDQVAAARFIAIVTDDATLRADCSLIPLDAADPSGSHVLAVADLVAGVVAGAIDG